MPQNFADRLLEAIDAKGSPVCVGLDPDLEKLPPELSGEPVRRVEAFCLKVIDAVAATVPAVKPQIAYFERLGSAGVAGFERVVAAAESAMKYVPSPPAVMPLKAWPAPPAMSAVWLPLASKTRT